MSLYPCSACAVRPVQQKLSNVTWAWNLADGTRVAWRQRLCQSCFILNVQAIPLLTPGAPLACPMCGISTEEDMDPVYCTAFLPGAGKFSFEWPTCGACATKLRADAQVGAVRLESRTESLGASASGPQTYAAASDWAGLGIVPR